jgi:hypothetical protein
MLQGIPNIAHNFYCNLCHYGCSKKYIYNQHLRTAKHVNAIKMATNDVINATNATEISQKNCCDCGKHFKHHSSYYRHKKKCVTHKKDETIVENNEPKIEVYNENNITPELIIKIIKQNQEFKEIIIEQNKLNQDLQKQIIEVCKNGTNNSITNNNTNTNSHNKTFNLQFFLNETCKDAMNIMDFVESIKVQLCDLEKVGQIGYVEGISNIIVKNLNSLDETKRPVHCTDVKREVLYVKDEDKWEKENNDKQKLRKVIKEVAYKNTKMLKEYKSKHPDCDKGESKFSDQYNKLIIEAMGGKGDNDLEKEDKIIKNIAKEVTIDK